MSRKPIDPQIYSVCSPPGEEIATTIARGGVATPFPYKLHVMLDAMETEASRGDTDGTSIVRWQPHGRAFKVLQPRRFVEEIMPCFFNQTKYASFQRQLNLYGFSRITNEGPDKGAVHHPCFVRGQKDLVKGMIRRKIKGTKFRRIVAPEDQPNFYNHHQTTKSQADEAATNTSIVVSPSSSLSTKQEISSRSSPFVPKEYLAVPPPFSATTKPVYSGPLPYKEQERPKTLKEQLDSAKALLDRCDKEDSRHQYLYSYNIDEDRVHPYLSYNRHRQNERSHHSYHHHLIH